MATPANRLGLCYETEAHKLGPPPVDILDAHTHLRGEDSVRVYQRVAEHYGVTHTWSMTPLEQVSEVRHVLGSAVQFIAQPDFRADNLLHAMGDGFLERIDAFHSEGAHLVKFWAAPRARDLGRKAGDPNLMMLDGPHRQRQMERTCELGMGIMTHIGDPDTWFATHYADASVYGDKASQYESFERAMEQFDVPWLAAHFGGWPEDLGFLDGLLAPASQITSRHECDQVDGERTLAAQPRRIHCIPRPVVRPYLVRIRHRSAERPPRTR